MSKLGKAPAAVGKAVRDLTDSAQQNLRQTLGGKADADARAEPVDLDVPKKVPPRRAESVDILKTRDPFRPPTLQKEIQPRRRENLSPLQRVELSQLNLVGIVWGIEEPTAMVEDSAGLGYIVKVGTPIGTNDGKVKAIYRNEILVEEFYYDGFGIRKNRIASKKLPND